MLILNDVAISAQNFGTRIVIFLTGNTKQAIEHRYFAFWNHGACTGELEWWSDNCAIFWIREDANETAEQKLLTCLINCALFHILNTENTKGENPLPRARQIGQEQLQALTWVNWYQKGSLWDIYAMGSSVRAEKETGNFDDDVIAKGLERNGSQENVLTEAEV